MPSTARRLAGFTESVIRGMTRLANCSTGPSTSRRVSPTSARRRNSSRPWSGPRRGSASSVCRHLGRPRFRQALARKITRFSGLPIDPDQHLVVTCGSTEAMMVAMMTACNPGDKVIVFSPFYENYAADAILSGAEPIYVPLRAPTFDFDPDEPRQGLRAEAQGHHRLQPLEPHAARSSRATT
jgi:aminotransferase